jgi:XRE family transcriptional regulator, regulator of sulfur utilization
MRSLIPERVPDELLNVMEFAPGASMRGTPHLPGTREYFTCLAGRVTIFVAGERFDLAAGDVLAFPGNVPHSYKNPDAGRSSHGVSAVILARAGV